MIKNKVLIVDDDLRISRLLKRIALESDVETLILNDPHSFEEIYLTYQPNIILMDLQMPQVDGIEILRRLAELKSNAAILIISGMEKNVLETAVDLGKSLKLNMVGFLNKPIDVDSVKKVLAKTFVSQKPAGAGSFVPTYDDFRLAIERDELVVYYQPLVDLETGKVDGIESLVRWQHPQFGLLFPDSFIPLAEEHVELIDLLTYKVLEITLKDDLSRRQDGVELKLAINLSARLLSDLNLPDKIEELLKKYDCSPTRLILEITESGAMDDASLTMDILTRLRVKNMRLSIDDFGTGYSSLLQLYRMPFNEIKVDKSFVLKAMTDKEAAEICRITVDLGHSLALKVVAEGVEDIKTYNFLRQLGCDKAQGYYMCRPIEASKLSLWITEYNEALQSGESP